jgi:predicted DNA-binding antitoxin AbrB/MazE fold protein
MLSKTIRARIHQGRIEPVEPVELPTEGTEVVVTVEEAALANEWFRKLHGMFAPVRERLRSESEEAIDERIAQAVKASRARKRGQA